MPFSGLSRRSGRRPPPRPAAPRLQCRGSGAAMSGAEATGWREEAEAVGEETVRIRLGERSYAVCKRKLVEQSDYFRALYRSGMREAAPGRAEQQLCGGLSARGLELVLDFISTACLARLEQEQEREGEGGGGEPGPVLQELVEAACYLQVTPLLRLLRSQVRLGNCLQLHGLAQLYGLRDLQEACLDFMAAHYHPVLWQARLVLPPALRQHLAQRRMRGAATLVAVGDLAGRPRQEEGPGSMLRYDEVAQQWLPLANNLPPDLVNVRGYGAATLDNYLFIVGGYRVTSQDISAAHCYNPCLNEWSQRASMNQKR